MGTSCLPLSWLPFRSHLKRHVIRKAFPHLPQHGLPVVPSHPPFISFTVFLSSAHTYLPPRGRVLSVCSQLCPQNLAPCLVPNCHSGNNRKANECQNFNCGPVKPKAFKRLFWKTAPHAETWASCISSPGQRSLVQGGS